MKRKTHTKKLLAAVSVAGLILSSTVSHADPIYTWLGTVDDDWENADNWDANGVPVDFDPGSPGLAFENSNPDRIVINATNFSPTTNVPVLHAGSSAVTPTVDVLNGHVAVSVDSARTGTGHYILNEDTFTTIGDGDVGSGLASLTITNPGQFIRHHNNTMSVTVNNDGSLIFGKTITIVRGAGALQVTLAGGSVTFTEWVRPQFGNDNPGDGTGNSWFDFTAEGATFTAEFGIIFADLDWVNHYIDEGEFFRSSTNLELEATDNGDGTFTVAVATSGASFPLTITQNASTPGTFDFEWDSQPGKVYDLLTSTDLADPISEWPIYDDGVTVHASIPSAGETTTLSAVPSTDPRRFFAMREFDAPPPEPFFFRNFENDNGGFTVETTGTGSEWQYGRPDAEIENLIAIDGGNEGSEEGAWGVELTGPYAAGTVTALRSPPIDLTGLPEEAVVQLTYALALDMGGDASLVVRVIPEDGDTVIGDAMQSITTQTTANWTDVGPFDLPEEALGQIVRIEWHFEGPTNTPFAYLGAYIDDVALTETTP